MDLFVPSLYAYKRNKRVYLFIEPGYYNIRSHSPFTLKVLVVILGRWGTQYMKCIFVRGFSFELERNVKMYFCVFTEINKNPGGFNILSFN